MAGLPWPLALAAHMHYVPRHWPASFLTAGAYMTWVAVGHTMGTGVDRVA